MYWPVSRGAEHARRRRRSASTTFSVVLGDRPLSTIRPGDAQDLLVGASSGADGTKRLVRQHFVALIQAAVDDELIGRRTRCRGQGGGAGHGARWSLRRRGGQAVYDAAPEWFRPAIMLGAGLGLRQAEASGLTADRIDWLGERTVRVDRQWSTQHGARAFTTPKSSASIRTIPAAQVVLDDLSRHVNGRDGFVMTDAEGEPVSYSRFGHAWGKTVKAAGVGPIRYHDLRHHFASVLISHGCSVKAVQKALGHSSAATTLQRVPGHMWTGDEDRIRAAVQAAFITC